MIFEHNAELKGSRSDALMTISTDLKVHRHSRRVVGYMPADAEGLRSKYVLLQHAWGMIALRAPPRHVVQCFRGRPWLEHLDWLMGERVRSYELFSLGFLSQLRISKVSFYDEFMMHTKIV